ncbi:MAG: TonB C-terminal domain-containing protein [Bdellovibrionales bacterium]|nr:TonB C-terminal domain-containing protein [Bdellovibrionales bacterium]
MQVYFEEPQIEQPRMVQAPATAKPLKEKPKDKAHFLSSQTQRVELETWQQQQRQAQLTADLGSQGQQNAPSDKQQEDRGQQAQNDFGDFQVDDGRRPLLLPGFSSTSSPPKIPQYIQEKMPPGVRLGNVTALNTDQHQYYSFNQRLLTRFIPLWGASVSRVLYQWLQDNDFPPVSKSWVTNVEVIMDDKGEILDVKPFRLSGFWDIDEAPIKAFKSVKHVPNPPKGMIDENGYIHLQFQTEVYWVPQPGIRFQGNRSRQRSN